MLINQCLLETLVNRDLNVEAQRVGFYVNATSCILARARCNTYNPITGQLQQPLNTPAGTTGRTGANSLQISATGDLRRAVEALKTTECSAKEKVTHFGQISETIISIRPGTSTANSASYYGHLSSAIAVFILFCEESESGVRMAAEENLARVVRHCESTGNIIRVQRDLYHEIKKNGNERSLRIALNIFAHYCDTIRQRKARTYAQNLLPCIYSISKRREPALLECLCTFTEVFCQQLEAYLTDGEVLKMTELFLEDLGSDCATKRRCAARNTLTFVLGSRNPEFYANNAFNRCIEQLLKCGQLQQQPNTVLGVMGCFRAILPIVLRSCSIEKAIETFDLCLHFLREGTHTIINATLEVLLVILANVQPTVRKVLLSEQCEHRRMLLKRKTLKNSIFKLNPSESLLSSRKSSTDARSDHLLRPGTLALTSTPIKFPPPIDDRSLASASDIELDSLKSMDLDTESRTAPALQLECSGSLDPSGGSSVAAPAPDTLSLKSQKSTDSIGSFLNTLLTNSNAAESVTKFFRKSLDKPLPDDGEEDRLSMDSMASSHMSSNAETVRAELDVTLEIDLDDTDPATVVQAVQPAPTPTPSRDTLDVPISSSMIADEPPENTKELFIGAIYDQNLLEFTTRLVCSRFLLSGSRYVLIPDSIVRVSVKSLAMQIVAACVRLKPELLCLPLEKDAFREEYAVVEILNLEDAINELSQEASGGEDQPEATGATATPLQEEQESGLLEMKEDHFGECTSTTYFEYFSPMSLSLDQGLKSKLKSIEENFSIDNNEKLSRDLDAILSQSEPGPGSAALTGPSAAAVRRRELLVVPKVRTAARNDARQGRSGEADSDKVLTAMSVSDRKEFEDEQQQLVADVLLFYDSQDPTLRGNVQLIVGNCMRAAIESAGSYHEFIRSKVPPTMQAFLSEDKMLQVVIMRTKNRLGQSLTSGTPFRPSETNIFLNDHSKTTAAPSGTSHLFDAILDRLMLLANNKYWLVQCKLFDVMVQLDYDCIRALGLQGDLFHGDCLDQLLAGLGDGDVRVRNHAGEKLLQLMERSTNDKSARGQPEPKQTVVGDFVNQFVLSSFAVPFDRRSYQLPHHSVERGRTSATIGRVLYRISNLLLKISDKNLQSGIINFLRLFLSKHNPFDYVELWNEYNLINVLLSLLMEMNGHVLDMTVHTDLLRICSQLLVVVVSSRPASTSADYELINKFIIHLLKLLNIYHHLFANITPIVINRVQKTDIFMNTKELQQINCFGFFGSDHACMKLYHQVRSSLESYRMTINAEAGQKLFDYLRAALEALWTLLEMKTLSTMTNGMKFLEEVLRYLQSFLSLQPDHCIRCTRFLLRFIFHANYVNRTAEVAYFRKAACFADDAPNEMPSEEFFVRYYDFCKAKSKPVLAEVGSYVKLFEPLVITCLKIFSKVSSPVQASILEMLCQLLDFNINYQLLDASSAFVESIFKHIEHIERGTVDDSEALMRQVVRFLFQLTGLVREKPLVTIPKIINICDNLLANNTVRRTALASVQALSHEVFLLRPTGKSLAPKVLEEAECSTQKEVVLNMLIKFPDELAVYRIVPMIMSGERLHEGNATNCELDILTAMLQVMREGKLVMKIDRDYNIVLRLMECFSRNVLLESKTILRFVEILYTTISNESCTALQRVIYGELIVRQVFSRTEERFLLHHVGLYLRKARAGIEDETTETTPEGCRTEDQPDEFVQQAVPSLVRVLVQYLRECFTTLEELQLTHNVSEETIQFASDSITRYMDTLTSMIAFHEISRVLAEQIPLEIIHWNTLPEPVVRSLVGLLIRHNFDTELVLSFVRNDAYNVRNDRSVRVLVEVLLEHKPNESKWDRSEIRALLASETHLLVAHFHPLLLCHITDEEFSKQIVRTILTGIEEKLSSVHFTLLEKSPLTTLSIMCNRLTDMLGTTNIVSSRNAALILGHKLDALVQLGAEGLRDSGVLAVLPESDFVRLYSSFTADRRRKFPKLFKTLSQLKPYYEACGEKMKMLSLSTAPNINLQALRDLPVDEGWYLRQMAHHCTGDSYTKPRNIARMLHELKSETKLINLLSSASLNVRLLRDIISVAFESMFHAFRVDCVQFNPHLNYLKVHPMLKVALIVLMRKLADFAAAPSKQEQDTTTMVNCAESVICFLEYLTRLEHLCLFYIEGRLIDRFVKEHLLKSNFFETLLSFGGVCARAVQQEPPENVTRIELYLRCIGAILNQRYLWNELNQNDRYRDSVALYVDVVYTLQERSLVDDQHFVRRRLPEVFQPFVEQSQGCGMDIYLKVIAIAELITDRSVMRKKLSTSGQLFRLIETVTISLLKLDRFYPYALTPVELYDCYQTLDAQENGHPKLPTIPIEHLYDVELLEMFLKRTNIFGYSSRQQFEELFMAMMVLLNRTEDPLFVSLLEQREIKHMCLQAVMGLLLSCYRYPWIGFTEGKFHHSTRNPKIRCDTIGLKKLHNIQLFIPLSNVFYQPNLERRLVITVSDDLHSTDDSSVGTVRFDRNQLSLDYFWEIIESTINQGQGSTGSSPGESLVVRNRRYFVEKMNIDVTSSMQLIYDVLKQLIEDEPALVLPHLVYFCEIVDNREQIYWLNQLLLKLQERVPMEDTLSQQHIIYLLCRLAALLVPALAELTHLCTIIPTYLKSTQLYIRNATLQGLICLLEGLVKTNSSIGALNDELQLLRNVIVNYVVKHGIIEESSGAFSDLHTKLVWTLNFYLIEHTSRFVADCNLLSNSIISANNILKRTTNLEIYLCILNGLERLVISKRVARSLHEKIEKLAIDLVKIDNEMFSLSALKLLVTCVYTSCNEQLESTERCNGIVQDEPDIIVQQIDKIEILFAKIRTTTPQGARVFGDVLCQLIRDLLPANEILTKVFKELMLNQPNPDIIAGVTFQLFRSAIDASYLTLLQEWLLCSLPNFLAFPQVNKSVWCLTVIFLSASLNQHLIKLLPEVLSLPSYQQLNEREINNFIVSARDFYHRLDAGGGQRAKFKEIFQQHDSFVFQSLVQCL
ncbi:AGAP003681-PA-like protein [Anopheles sinensis]|uniref:AGAP003681-PA-like protein n=1 Tax=Anopheles sinensis TaxID=74873 RepID=A0A084VEI7_ANOSI|nr:AGAP003681-PA-like protein [Anopheles sinensis]